MLACAHGHREAALQLYRWNRVALRLVNNSNQSAVQLAKAGGHGELASVLERLDRGFGLQER